MQEHKKQRLASILRTSLSSFIKEELVLPSDHMASVSRVELSDKGTLAKIYISIFPANEELEKDLKKLGNKAVGYLKRNESLKYAPAIRFLSDNGEEARENIENLLKS